MERKPYCIGLSLSYTRRRVIADRKNSLVADAVAVGIAAALLAIFLRNHSAGPGLVRALAITVIFAALGRIARGVNFSGSLAGAAIAFIMAGRDLRAFVVLLIVFFLTLAATRLGRLRKEYLNVAESSSGRSASQVLANLGIAAAALSLPAFDACYLLSLSALAEAAADTVSSEIGSAFQGKTVLVTTWREVVPGTDGGVSLGGTTAAIAAAIAIAASSRMLGLVSTPQAAIVASAGTAGMLVDSALGAIFERRGYLNNDLVNILGTAAAAGFAALSMLRY